MDLHQQVETIQTREDLARFIDRLAREAGPDWENPELSRYLEALGAWTADMDGFFRNQGEAVPDSPSWRLVGQMLLAATIYE